MKNIYKFPVVNSKKIISKANKQKHAIAHFNVMNLLWLKTIVESANEINTPVIVAVTEAKVDYLGGLKNFADMVNNIIRNFNNPVEIAIHLDHSYSINNCKKAIDLGFSSVMFDGSKLSIEENIKKLKELTNYAQKYNVTVEGEIGSIGGVEDNVAGMGLVASNEHAKMISHSNIDLLAAGVGNAHGKYPPNWKELHFDTIVEIKNISNKYLVLHGASGIPEDQIKKAIKLGINKININSELLWSFANELKQDFNNKIYEKNGWEDPRILFANSYEAMKKTIKHKIKLFSNKI